MANNRLFLIHRPSGAAVMLGKRMAWGWYAPPDEDRMQEFYAKVEDCPEGSQDDFVLAIESNCEAPHITDEWDYETDENGRPIPALRKVATDG